MSSNFTVESDIDKVAEAMQKDARKTVKNVSVAVVTFADLISEKAAEKISKPNSTNGVKYSRGDKTRYRSVKGDPPNTDTGILVSSIHSTIHSPFVAETGSLDNIADYGDELETTMGRPWLKPTLDENNKMFQIYIDKALVQGGLVD